MNEKRMLRASVPQTPLTTEEQKSLESNLFETSLWKEAKQVFVYVARFPEPDTKAIIAKAFEQGKTVSVPLCTAAGEMRAVIIDSLTELTPGAYSIPEPAADGKDMEGDFLAVTPCVACSVDRVRLGHGMGYYDNFLTRNPVKSVCLCRDEALLNYIPGSSHDIKPDLVVTQSRVVK